MPNITSGSDQLTDLVTIIPLCAALSIALLGGTFVWRRFDRHAAVCSLPLLTIGGYNVALATLVALGFIR